MVTKEDRMAANRPVRARFRVGRMVILRNVGDQVRLRFLNVKDLLSHPIEIHNNIGPDRSKTRCTRSLGQRCFFCDEAARRLAKNPNSRGAEALKAQTHGLFAALDMADPSEVKVFRLPPGSANRLLDFDESPQYFGLGELEIGRCVTITYPQDIKRGYQIEPEDQITPVDPSVLEGLPDLEAIYKPLTYEQQRALHEDGWEAAIRIGASVPSTRDDASIDETAFPDVSEAAASPAPTTAEPPIKLPSAPRREPSVDQPECFGLAWDPNDKELCQPCEWQQNCIEAQNAKQKVRAKAKKAASS